MFHPHFSLPPSVFSFLLHDFHTAAAAYVQKCGRVEPMWIVRYPTQTTAAFNEPEPD